MFGFLFRLSPVKTAKILQKANSLYEQQKFARAIPLYKKILRSDSTHFAAMANLAVCYFEVEEYALSIPLFCRSAELDSANPWWHNYLSQSYQKTGRFAEALEAAWQAVELSGGAAEHHLNMAYTVYETADEKGRGFVEPYLQKWYKKYKENGIVQQSYKSFFYDKNFRSSNLDYVEKLFDVFAENFDEVLNGLEYHSPSEIAQSLKGIFADKKPEKIRVLDLGCGSGLCGKYIKEQMPETDITGVDISEKMLVEAEAKKVYDKLVKSDLMSCFDNIKNKFDAVVASDVLTYFGSLDSLFACVADSLIKGGVFIFTVSINTTNSKDWFLQPCSRFAHNEKYVGKMIAKNGFEIIKNEEKILRREGDKNVVGRLISAYKK